MEISKNDEPSYDVISALAAAGSALHDIARRYDFSAGNKQRLVHASGLMQKVFSEVTNGTDHDADGTIKEASNQVVEVVQ
jgi:hypothetical protein